jgi:hypothetical protein
MAHVVENRRHWAPASPWLLAGAGCGLLAALMLAGARPPVRSDDGQDVVGGRTTDVALARLEHALERGDGRSAERAWQDAYVSALRGGWQTRVAVGDAALRLGGTGLVWQTAQARARQNYLAALFVAQGQRSVEGAIWVAEAFLALGDHEPAMQSLRVADALGPPDDAALRDRLEAVRERLSRVPALTTGSSDSRRNSQTAIVLSEYQDEAARVRSRLMAWARAAFRRTPTFPEG